MCWELLTWEYNKIPPWSHSNRLGNLPVSKTYFVIKRRGCLTNIQLSGCSGFTLAINQASRTKTSSSISLVPSSVLSLTFFLRTKSNIPYHIFTHLQASFYCHFFSRNMICSNYGSVLTNSQFLISPLSRILIIILMSLESLRDQCKHKRRWVKHCQA